MSLRNLLQWIWIKYFAKRYTHIILRVSSAEGLSKTSVTKIIKTKYKQTLQTNMTQ